MKLIGSKTEKNLLDAFAGESQARNKYTYFAKVAKKEGYEQISKIFLETAENEKEHAKLHFKALGLLGDTMANLQEAAAGENFEWKDMYPRMAKEAREEGFGDIAIMMERIGDVEEKHEARYKKLLQNIKDGVVFQKAAPTEWKCLNCGYIHKGEKAAEECPACKHPKAYFEVLSKNY